MRRRAIALLPIAPLLTLSACGSDEIEVEDLESSVAEELDHFGIDEAEVDCPDTLDAEVGEELTCTATGDDDGDEVSYDVELTVFEVDGDESHFEIDIPSITGGDVEIED